MRAKSIQSIGGKRSLMGKHIFYLSVAMWCVGTTTQSIIYREINPVVQWIALIFMTVYYILTTLKSFSENN